jgi:type IV secretory pathway VirB4 component
LPTDDAATSDAKAKINDERSHAEMDRRERDEREAKTDKMNAEFLLRKHTSEDEERGYHHITVLEFLADKNDLARASAKV